MKDFYDPKKLIPVQDEDDYHYNDELVIYKDDAIFHIGSDESLETVYCKICGGNDFKIGRGSYYTAIKCVKCEWETCIHEG